MPNKRNILKINILDLGKKKKKKKKERHPAGGYYWGPDFPKGTPKQYKSKTKPLSPGFPQGRNIRDIA